LSPGHLYESLIANNYITMAYMYSIQNCQVVVTIHNNDASVTSLYRCNRSTYVVDRWWNYYWPSRLGKVGRPILRFCMNAILWGAVGYVKAYKSLHVYINYQAVDTFLIYSLYMYIYMIPHRIKRDYVSDSNSYDAANYCPDPVHGY